MRADLIGAKPGPSLAICGEMDSLILPSHPECDPATGAVHACGHNSHIATMLGAAIGLVQANAQNDISGKVAFIPCPAEECIETEWRSKLIKEGKIKALGGKASLILEGVFDDIDMSIMNHLGCAGYSVLDNNGFCMKNVTFHGKSAHAAGSPQHSINALSAANLALHALALLRETYSGDQYIRSHGILTHGGMSPEGKRRASAWRRRRPLCAVGTMTRRCASEGAPAASGRARARSQSATASSGLR